MNIKYFIPEGINALVRRIRSSKFRNRKIDHNYEETNHNRISLITKGLFSIKSENLKYLEIGCFKNEVFNSIPLLDNQKIGVDPIEGGNIRKTSDDFFKENNDFFDIVFIDGLHTYHQIKKDIINSLQVLNKNGIIFIHDLIPDSEISSLVQRDKFTSNWNGDVYRVIFDLMKNDNLSFKIANIDFGVGILKKKKEGLIEFESNNIDYKYFKQNKTNLPIISLEEAFKFIEGQQTV